MMRRILGVLLILAGCYIVLYASLIAWMMAIAQHAVFVLCMGVAVVLIGVYEVGGKRIFWRGKWPPPE